MQNQMRSRDFIECRLECLNQGRRQFLNEPNGVGDGYFTPFGQLELPCRGVEGCKELVIAEDIGVAETVDQT